jgi:hypothetical protein
VRDIKVSGCGRGSSPQVFSTGSLEPAIPRAAAVAWFVLLFILALWTFHKKAAE